MTIIQDLKGYYDREGISATEDFRCKHLSDCKRDCTTFTTAREAYVGKEYGQGEFPRLLFLSLDSGNDPKARTMEEYRAQEETSCNVNELPKNRHWYRTHELAHVLLKKFVPAAELASIHFYFAHTNSAKCCMNKAQSKKADKVLFKNCQKYLKQELEILNPKIVVTQGNEAKEAISKILESHIKDFKDIDDKMSIIRLNGKEVFWLHTYHPSSWGLFNKQRKFNWETRVADGWERYAERIKCVSEK